MVLQMKPVKAIGQELIGFVGSSPGFGILPKHPTHDAVYDDKYIKLTFVSSSFYLLLTLISQIFWKHIHILVYHPGVSHHRILYWI